MLFYFRLRDGMVPQLLLRSLFAVVGGEIYILSSKVSLYAAKNMP